MHISLDYQPIEVNTYVATESYATECNCKYPNMEFCRKPSIRSFTHSYKIYVKLNASAFKTQVKCEYDLRNTSNVQQVL